mgnify:CR=1 FL=1
MGIEHIMCTAPGRIINIIEREISLCYFYNIAYEIVIRITPWMVARKDKLIERGDW